MSSSSSSSQGKTELSRLKAELEAMRAAKVRADERAAAAVLDKNMILRLRSNELTQLKLRVTELEMAAMTIAQQAAPAKVMENPPIKFPNVDLVSALTESLRRSDEACIAALRDSVEMMANHPMLPELFSRMSNFLK